MDRRVQLRWSQLDSRFFLREEIDGEEEGQADAGHGDLVHEGFGGGAEGAAEKADGLPDADAEEQGDEDRVWERHVEAAEGGHGGEADEAGADVAHENLVRDVRGLAVAREIVCGVGDEVEAVECADERQRAESGRLLDEHVTESGDADHGQRRHECEIQRRDDALFAEVPLHGPNAVEAQRTEARFEGEFFGNVIRSAPEEGADAEDKGCDSENAREGS
mmetsp:Transcript_22269/g.68540  ORF Transcript_22269/g.68540 Transcript_22269/m.68540 type:complete len:220 (+) Transcript_22269:55-714(+)